MEFILPKDSFQSFVKSQNDYLLPVICVDFLFYIYKLKHSVLPHKKGHILAPSCGVGSCMEEMWEVLSWVCLFVCWGGWDMGTSLDSFKKLLSV